MSVQTGKSLGNKVVLAKIPREEFTRFQQYCDKNGETINSSLRRLILTEIDNPHFSRIAVTSNFAYNRRDDNFSWTVTVDDSEKIFEIDSGIPASSLEHLREAIENAIAERNTAIRKSRKDSVPFPSELLRRKGAPS